MAGGALDAALDLAPAAAVCAKFQLDTFETGAERALRRRFGRNVARIGTMLGLALFAVQVWQGWGAIALYGIELQSLPILIVAVGFSCLAVVIQLLAWNALMQGLGFDLYSFDAARGYLVSFVPRYVPGIVWGYVTRGQWFLDHYRIPLNYSAFASLAEMTFGVTSAVSIVLLAQAGDFDPKVLLLLVALWLAAFVFLLISSHGDLARFCVCQRRMEQKPMRSSKTPNVIRRLGWPWAISLLLFFFLWGANGIALALTAKALGWDMSNHLFAATYACGFAWLAGVSAIFVPAGLGARELALASLLTNGLGVPGGIASAIAVAYRFTSLIGEGLTIVMLHLAAKHYP